MPWEALGDGIEIAMDEICRFGEDALLLARFCAPQPQERACDLGTGGGILPLYWCRREPPAHIDAVEREAAFAALARTSVAHNHLEARIAVYEADWNALDGILPAHAYTLVSCNPPYFAHGRARESADPLLRAMRHEDSADALPHLCKSAARLLCQGGRFCLCQRPERLSDVLCALRDVGLFPRRLQWVQQQAGDAPWLFLCEATRSCAQLRVLPPLCTTEKGTHTAVYKRLYR